MIEVNMKADTESAKNAIVQFIDNYKDTINQYINTVIGNDGTPVDAGIEVKEGAITIYQLAPDKGFVLGETTGDTALPIELKKYKDVKTGARYILPEKELMVLHLKTEEGKPDAKLGVFKTLTDAVTEFNSESVKQVIKNYNDREQAIAKREAKQEAKLKKLGLTDVESTPVEPKND